MYEKLIETLNNLKQSQVLVVGDFMLDISVYGDALRISPEAPVPVLKIARREYDCGGAGSVAADLAVLGAKPICLGAIGNDENGRKLLEKLCDYQADTRCLVTNESRPTITKQRLIGLAQHRHPQQLMRIDEEATEPLSEDDYATLIELYTGKLDQVDIVCLQDHNKGFLSNAFCQELIKRARKAAIPILVDPCMHKDYSKYKGATLITPNRKEAHLATEIDIVDESTAAQAAAKLYKELKLDAVVITMDKEGAYLKSADDECLVPTKPRNVYDVTGAGDMVLSTLAATIAGGCDYLTAVQLANVASGIEVEKFGAATVSIEEMLNEIMMESHGYLGKFMPLDQLVRLLGHHRKQGHKIVFTNGCFDVIHRGHIEYLNFCKTHGDILVVGLNSDDSVRRQNKGPGRPINNEQDRAAVLSALQCVDYIALFGEPTPLDIITEVEPDILVKGEDWKDKGVVGREFVEARGGQVILAKLVEGKSSTSIIEKIKDQETQNNG